MRAWVLLLSVVVCGCSTLPRGPVLPDTKFRMRELKLANGLRVIVEEDHATPLVGVFTVVGVGSSGDPEGKAGLAHLLEHLAFRARPGGKDTAWNQLEGAGVGFLNASTSFDETVYMNVGTKDLLPKLLAIETGRMIDPLSGVDQGVLDVEREVVRNELRQRGENAIGPAFNFIQEAVFPSSHPYSRPVGGSHESLSAIQMDDVKKFALKNYRPDNMTMLIIGDVDLETIEETIKKALPSPVFFPRPAKTATPSRLTLNGAEPPAPPEKLLVTKNATVSTPELYVVWSLPRGFNADDAVMLEFLTVLADQELSDAAGDPDVVGVSAFPIAGAEASMLVVQAKLKRGDNPQRSLERVLDQVVKLWSGTAGREFAMSDAAITIEREYVFSRQRSEAAVQLTVDAENIMSRGTARASAAHFTGDPLMYGRQLKALAQVSPGQVSSFAEKYLARSRARAVLVMPFTGTEAGKANGPAGLAPTESLAMTTELSGERVRELGRAHMAQAKLETVVRAKREHIETVLPNGLKVVIHKRNYALPVVAAQLTFTRGTGDSEPKGAPELGRYVAYPKAHAYGGAYGISWRSGMQVDRSRILATGSAGNLPNILAHLSERVTSMNVDTGMLSYYRGEAAETVEAGDDLPVAKASRAVTASLFRGHPWGTVATLRDSKELSAGDIEGWYDRAWSPDNAVLVVTGDLDAEKTMKDIEQWLGPWKQASKPFAAATPISYRKSAVELISTPQSGSTQAQVHVACLADASAHSKALANDILASVISTALFEKIRGELGASYGFGGGAELLVGGAGRIDWGGSIENARLPQAMAVMSKVMKNFESETLTDRALERARWSVARDATMGQATSPLTAEVFTQRVLAGHKTTELDAALFDSLAAVGKAEVLEAWNRCHGHMAISLVGDETRIGEATKGVEF